jgi:hypothetical protein
MIYDTGSYYSGYILLPELKYANRTQPSHLHCNGRTIHLPWNDASSWRSSEEVLQSRMLKF